LSSRPTFVIIGASLAGASAAETLRTEGFEGRVVLIGEEDVRPYERPPLSKDYLRGEVGTDAAFVHDASFYEKNEIDLRLSSRVTSLDTRNRVVDLASGESVGYDAVLIATGAVPRPLAIPGANLEGVHYLRQLADSDRIREGIRSAGRVVVIGAGWIGCEVAASARQMGAEVAMVATSRVPLGRALGPELGEFYRDVHLEHGVEMHLGTGVRALRGNGSVGEVVLADGQALAADLVVVGLGVVPRAELADGADLTLDNGVLTSEYLAASAPGVFAAGDVANAWHPTLQRNVRLEHWSSALNQGPVAARNMLGRPTPYVKIPYFYSDQYDIGMEHSGLATEWDRLVFRGDPKSREFIAFWLKDGRLLAGMNVNVWDVAEPIATIVASRQELDADLLTDPDVDLADLVGKVAGG
jgi:3-phenylpropionate/trans-cinnamate dioxygenase ferredoxin reductase subunit